MLGLRTQAWKSKNLRLWTWLSLAPSQLSDLWQVPYSLYLSLLSVALDENYMEQTCRHIWPSTWYWQMVAGDVVLSLTGPPLQRTKDQERWSLRMGLLDCIWGNGRIVSPSLSSSRRQNTETEHSVTHSHFHESLKCTGETRALGWARKGEEWSNLVPSLLQNLACGEQLAAPSPRHPGWLFYWCYKADS